MCSNVLTAKSANGEGYETYLMGRLVHNFPSKALYTHTRARLQSTNFDKCWTWSTANLP